jgi:hypothetical protein
MKTAGVTIPPRVCAAAKKAAKRLGIPAARLCSLAIKDFIRRTEVLGLTARINRALSGQDSGLDPLVAQMQFASLEKEVW